MSVSIMPGVNKLKKAWNENPLVVIGIATGTMMAASRLIDSISSIQSKRAYARRAGIRTRTTR